MPLANHSDSTNGASGPLGACWTNSNVTPRRQTVVATIGATAPFVGLFGTVIGIIHAFEKMATSGGGIASVSAGIAEALITTAFGLFVAIPAVWRAEERR